jgi:uncharacterized protein
MEPTDLRRDECLRLLAGSVVGRVVYTEGALPAARPVMYGLDGDEVVFRAAPGATLAAGQRVVAFEVDAFDLEARTGWSVLGVGVAYEVTDSGRLAALSGRVPDQWTDGRATTTVAIPLQRLTGRRLAPPGRDG